MAGDNDNPRTYRFSGTVGAPAVGCDEGIATTAATAKTSKTPLSAPICTCEWYNASTGAEVVYVSFDGGRSFKTLGARQAFTLDAEDTSPRAGGGKYNIKSLVHYASATAAILEITPTFRHEVS